MPREDTQFKPGNNANPGGRPKGFATKIKELCGDDYEKIARGLYMIAFGAAHERAEFFGESVRVSAKDRIAAAVALRDSGPGKPVQTLEHRGDVPQPRKVSYERQADVDLDADEDVDTERGVA